MGPTLAMWWALSWAAPAPESAGKDACSIRWTGVVVEAGTGEGIPEASLVYHSRAGHPRYAQTDARGAFAVEGLCPGVLQVTATKAEHSALHVEVDLVAPTTNSTLGLDALHEHHDARVIVVHDESATSSSASETLAGAELARTRGQGLADAIANMSGVSVLRTGAGGMGRPIIRGHIGRRNLILVDGIRHEGQEWGLDHAPEVDPNAAGRITVIKGAATTRYGPEANGGVVLLESRPLLRQPGVAGEVGAVGQTNALGGGGLARIDYAPARARGLAIRVEGNASRTRAALAPDYPLDNTGAETWNASARIGYLGDRIDVDFAYRVLRSRLGICTCLRISSGDDFESGLARREPVGADRYSAELAIERPRQEIWHHLALARARIPIAGAGELHATYAFQFNDRKEFAVVRDNVTGPQIELELATHLLEFEFEHAAQRIGDWALVGTAGIALGQQNNDFYGATTLIPDYGQWSWGVYDVERFVRDRIELEFGVRYDGMHRNVVMNERHYSGQLAGGRIDESTCQPDGRGGTCVRAFHAPSATIGLVTRPFRKLQELSLRTQLDSSARIPAIDEQFMNGASPSFPILGFGSSRIGIERTWGGESTVTYAGDWLTVEASGYANWIDNYIAFVPKPQPGQCAPLTCTTRGPFQVFEFQPTDALFGGGEVRFDLVAPRLPLGLTGSGAWVRARDLSADTFLPLIPSDRYSLGGRWWWPDTRVSARGYLELRGTVVARQSRADPELDFAAPPPAYVLLGAGVGVEFPARNYVVRSSASGTNLLNARYREYTSLLRYFADEPGWGVQLRLSVDFDLSTQRGD
ncbi:MAG: TonB-dependent receptor [Deltaproteobacteria bacterium]|nr:TonB-dependent receptor [Nannocystaceae bacterium]